MQKYTLTEHLTELKKCCINSLIFFLIIFLGCLYINEYLVDVFFQPLTNLTAFQGKKIIYTGLAEAFFSYLQLASFVALIVSLPFFVWQIYNFLAPGLTVREKKIIRLILLCAPCLFYFGIIFVYYFIMPKAWLFFLGYEKTQAPIPLLLEAKISEYLDLTIKFSLVFGVAFQLPIIISVLHILTLINTKILQTKRRLAIVFIFILAALFTPPDIISQIGLAIPLILLYEFSIKLCSLIDQGGEHARSKMDKK